jgi:hypothetical protein
MASDSGHLLATTGEVAGLLAGLPKPLRLECGHCPILTIYTEFAKFLDLFRASIPAAAAGWSWLLVLLESY